MRDDRANHYNGEQDRRIEGVTGNQQADTARQFQKDREVPEPLAEADLVKLFNHCRETRKLGAAGRHKGQGDNAGKNPESEEAALGGGWRRVCCHCK